MQCGKWNCKSISDVLIQVSVEFHCIYLLYEVHTLSSLHSIRIVDDVRDP